MPRSINARTDASGPPLFAPPNTLNRNDISPPESLNPLVLLSIAKGGCPPVSGWSMGKCSGKMSGIFRARSAPKHSTPRRRVLGRLHFYPAEILVGWDTPGGDRASPNEGIVTFGAPGALVLVNIGGSRLVQGIAPCFQRHTGA